jgi:hypothetical protein
VNAVESAKSNPETSRSQPQQQPEKTTPSTTPTQNSAKTHGAILNAGTGSSPASSSSGNWVFGIIHEIDGIKNDSSESEQVVMWDSGAEASCCPYEFGQHNGVKQDYKLNLRSVQGSEIRHYGQRQVPVMLEMVLLEPCNLK